MFKSSKESNEEKAHKKWLHQASSNHGTIVSLQSIPSCKMTSLPEKTDINRKHIFQRSVFLHCDNMGTSQIKKISFVAWLLSDWCFRSFQYPYKPITFHFLLVVDSSNWIISPNIRGENSKNHWVATTQKRHVEFSLPAGSSCELPGAGASTLPIVDSMVENHGTFRQNWAFQRTLWTLIFGGVLLEKKGYFLTSFGPKTTKMDLKLENSMLNFALRSHNCGRLIGHIVEKQPRHLRSLCFVLGKTRVAKVSDYNKR